MHRGIRWAVPDKHVTNMRNKLLSHPKPIQWFISSFFSRQIWPKACSICESHGVACVALVAVCGIVNIPDRSRLYRISNPMIQRFIFWIFWLNTAQQTKRIFARRTMCTLQVASSKHTLNSDNGIKAWHMKFQTIIMTNHRRFSVDAPEATDSYQKLTNSPISRATQRRERRKKNISHEKQQTNIDATRV